MTQQKNDHGQTIKAKPGGNAGTKGGIWGALG
jgi:hypothetical protein